MGEPTEAELTEPNPTEESMTQETTPALPPERIAELREFFGPRTYGCECKLSWDEMTALLDASDRLSEALRMLEEERGQSKKLDAALRRAEWQRNCRPPEARREKP